MYTKLRGIALACLIVGTGFAQQPDQNGIYMAGFGVAAPKLVHAAPAVLPSGSNLQGLKHLTSLEVTIGSDGVPQNIELRNSPSPAFDDAAIAAVKQSQFEPGKLRGKTVPVKMLLWVPFGTFVQEPVTLASLYQRKIATPPVAINAVEARFSDEARQKHIQGTVLVSVVVDEQGMPTNVRILRPAGYGLDEEALQAIKKYRFKPARLQGVPIAVNVTIEVNFRLG